MSGLVEVVAPLDVLVREIGVAPGVADADVDRHGEDDVHHHAGDHHQKIAAKAGFARNSQGWTA